MATRKSRIVDAARRHVMEDTALILGVDVAGQFKRPYIQDEYMEGYQPVFFCVSEDIPAGTQQKTSAVIDGVDYEVSGMEPDGNGFTTIELAEV